MAFNSGGGERTRFPCLAMARYFVATVVSALAVAVVVMVITVGVRPGDISLSVLQGHVEASNLWSRNDTIVYEAIVRGHPIGRASGPRQVGGGGETGITTAGGGGGTPCTDCGVAPWTVSTGGYVWRTYTAAEQVNLRVTLSAYNPSGRVDIRCGDITLGVLDTPAGAADAPLNLTDLVEIARIHLDNSFVVKRQSSHTLRRWVSVDSPAVLAYIARTYGGRDSFSAVVQVNATVTTVSSVAKTKSNAVKQTCWPVTVGVDDPSTSALPVTCKPTKDFQNAILASPLAPAPAPAPMAADG